MGFDQTDIIQEAEKSNSKSFAEVSSRQLIGNINPGSSIGFDDEASKYGTKAMDHDIMGGNDTDDGGDKGFRHVAKIDEALSDF